MSSTEGVTHWVRLLKSGDSQAAQNLWEGYYHRLVALARGKLQGASRRVIDEEDVALSAFASFCRGVERGRFPRLDDRTDLWRVLVTITARKAIDSNVRERRLKRRPRNGEVVSMGSPGAEDAALEAVIGNEPTPAFAAQLAEEYHGLLNLLDDQQRLIAIRKVEGFTNEEIAAELGRSVATVERKLHLIREIWQQERGAE
jgi:RNA polymerase sigma factor (sigma-70 family)